MNIFKLVGSVFVDTDKANDSLSKTDKKAEGVGNTLLKGVATAGKFAVGLGAACVAGATALVGVAKGAASTADNVDKMSQRLGVSKTAFQELDFVLSQSGVDINSFQTGMKTLLKNMDGVSEGNKTSIGNFEKLGVTVQNANGTLKSQEEVLFDTIKAFQAMEDSSEKSRLAQELFGKQGQEIIPLLNAESGSLEEMRKQAHDLGLVLSDDAVDAGVKLTDTMDQTKRAFDSIVTKIGVSVMPIIQSALEWLLGKMPVIQEVMGVTFGVIEKVVSTAVDIVMKLFGGLSEKFEETGITFETISATIGNVFSALFSALSEIWNTVGVPIFEFIKQIVGTVTGYFSERFQGTSVDIQQVFSNIAGFWNEHLKPCFQAITDFLNNVIAPVFELVFKHYIGPVVMATFNTIKELWNNTLKPVFTNIVDFIKNIFTLNFSGAFKNLINIVKGIWNGIIAVVKTPINVVIGIINSFIGGLNKLKIPDWVPGVGGKGINISKIPLLAKGGTILEAGHAIVGEAGAELIDLPAGARVTPLTNKNGDVLGTDKMLEVLNLILAELKQINEDLYETIIYALLNGVKINWNDRELARLVRKYA